MLTPAYLESVWETLPRHVRPTLLLPCPALSARLGCEITIASETFQHTGSFKFRAAYNTLRDVRERHVVAASSGNFGQAVAFAAKLLGRRCTIVMPSTSAQVKVDAVRAHGGAVELTDTTKVSRAERVRQIMAGLDDAFLAQAYDDERVVAGNRPSDARSSRVATSRRSSSPWGEAGAGVGVSNDLRLALGRIIARLGNETKGKNEARELGKRPRQRNGIL